MIKKISNKKPSSAKTRAVPTNKVKAVPANKVKVDAEFEELLKKFVAAAETFTKPKK